MEEKINYYENFLAFTRELAHGEGIGIRLTNEFEMFLRFLRLMGEEHFNRNIEWFVDDTDGNLYGGEFDNWYYSFHKSMRQTDFYEIGEGHLDMLFHTFLNMSEVPYKVFQKFFKNEFKPSLLTLNWDES